MRDYQIKEKYMGGIRSMHRYRLWYIGVDGRVILNWILREQIEVIGGSC
jgi:hypothetical protein